jgi:hypothetical protein
MKLQTYVLSLFAIGMALFLLANVGMIWLYGRFYIYESSTVILSMETAMMVGILAFSAYCAVNQLRQVRH